MPDLQCGQQEEEQGRPFAECTPIVHCWRGSDDEASPTRALCAANRHPDAGVFSATRLAAFVAISHSQAGRLMRITMEMRHVATVQCLSLLSHRVCLTKVSTNKATLNFPNLLQAGQHLPKCCE